MDDQRIALFTYSLSVGDSGKCQAYLDEGGDPNVKSRSGEPALSITLHHRQLHLTSLLLKYNADPNFNGMGYTLITEACKTEEYTICKELLEAKCNPCSEDQDHWESPLEVAISNNSWDIVKLLILHGAIATPRSLYAREAIDKLFAMERYDLLRLAMESSTPSKVLAPILFRHCVKYNAKGFLYEVVQYDDGKWTPARSARYSPSLGYQCAPTNEGYNSDHKIDYLHLAVEIGSTETIRELVIARGIDINTTDRTGRTPLFFVKSLDIATLLLELNASIHATDQRGQTPLHCAATPDIAHLLIEKGLSPESVDVKGCTPIVTAYNHSRWDVVRLFLNTTYNLPCDDVFISPNTPDDILHTLALRCPSIIHSTCPVSGATPLYLAVFSQNLSLVKNLLQHRANPNACSPTSVSPLFTAISQDNTQCVQLLINASADVNILQSNGYTSLHYARSAHTANLLISHGAVIDPRDAHTQMTYVPSPLMEQVLHQRWEVARLLISHGATIDFSKAGCNTIDAQDILQTKEQRQYTDALIAVVRAAVKEEPDDNVIPVIQYLLDMGAGVIIARLPLLLHNVKDTRIAQSLLVEGSFDLNALDGTNCTALGNATCVNMVRLLLHHGARMHPPPPSHPSLLSLDKTTALASMSFPNDSSQQSLGPRPYRDTATYHALHTCIVRGHWDAVKLLVEHQADLNTRDNSNATALHTIITQRNASDPSSTIKWVRYLLEHGANPNLVSLSRDGGLSVRTQSHYPLITAIATSQHDIAHLLLAFRAYANCTTQTGDTPLTVAIRNGSERTVQLLLHCGANPNKGNPLPLAIACETSRFAVVRMLMEAKADPSKITCDGMNVLCYVRSSDVHIRDYLERFMK